MSLLDILDPFGWTHESRKEKLSREQFEWQKDITAQNLNNQEYWNEKNFDMQRMAFDYQKGLNALQMEREDNAVLRRVQDLKNAGLSPTLAAGSAASATPVHAGTAPQGVAPQRALVDDPRIQVEMFKEQMQKDRIALASTVLSNMADVSRTKAETAMINAQKDRFIAESPIALRLKELEQIIAEQTSPATIASAFADLHGKELDNVNKKLDNIIASNDVAQLALKNENMRLTNLLVDANVELAKARRSNVDADTKVKQEEAMEKTFAVKMAEILYNNTEQAGVHPTFMTNRAKEMFALHNIGANNVNPGNEPLPTSGSVLGKVLGKLDSIVPKGWKSPSMSKYWRK